MRIAAHVAAAVLVAALGTPSALAAPAKKQRAKVATLKGQVVGQPYTAGKRTAMPILLDAKSARRAKLKSRLGVLQLSAKRLKAPRGKRIAPGLLRVGDRVRARAKVRRAARRAGYWQLSTRRLEVRKRSKTLSAAELQDLVAALRTDLAKLGQAVTGLAGYTANGFRVLTADMAALRADLNALRSDFNALAAQVAAASAQLAALEAALRAEMAALGADLRAELQDVVDDVAALNAAVAAMGAQIATLQGQVATLTSDLAALSATVAALSGQLGDLGALAGTAESLLVGAAPGDLADALADIGALQTRLAAVEGVVGGPTSGLVQQVNGLSTVVGGAGSGLVGAVSQLQVADVAARSDITALESSMADAQDRLGDLETLVGGPGGLAADVAALEATVGNAGSGLVQQVDGLESDVGVLCGPASPLDALC